MEKGGEVYAGAFLDGEYHTTLFPKISRHEACRGGVGGGGVFPCLNGIKRKKVRILGNKDQ